MQRPLNSVTRLANVNFLLGGQKVVGTVVFEVVGEFSAEWPSGSGNEIGSVYSSAGSISDFLKQPFIFSHGHLFAFFSLHGFGICLLHTEAIAEGFLPNRLSAVPRDFFEIEAFYSLYVDKDTYATHSFPVDELQSVLGGSMIDMYEVI